MLKATITADGRLKFPAPLLKTLGITKSTEVYIENDGQKIVVFPVNKICALCHGTDDLIDGFPFCRSCGEKVSDVMTLV